MQPCLKPSCFRPIPILREEKVTIIPGVINFALHENKLPQAHHPCLPDFYRILLIINFIKSSGLFASASFASYLCTGALHVSRSAKRNFALAVARVDTRTIAAEPYSIAVATTACSKHCMAARATRSLPIRTKPAKHEMSIVICITTFSLRSQRWQGVCQRCAALVSDREDTRTTGFADVVHQK